MKSMASSPKALISLTLGGFECCKSCTRANDKVGNEFSWFGWPDWPRNVRIQIVGRRGKVLHWLFAIVGMAYQSHNVNKAIADDRVARSTLQGVWRVADMRMHWPLFLYVFFHYYISILLMQLKNPQGLFGNRRHSLSTSISRACRKKE